MTLLFVSKDIFLNEEKYKRTFEIARKEYISAIREVSQSCGYELRIQISNRTRSRVKQRAV